MADYAIRMDDYLAFCENKDRPEIQCNGRCQLDKKIQQENHKDQQNPERKSEHKNEYCTLQSDYFLPDLNTYKMETTVHFPYTQGEECKRSTFVFHPPDYFI